MKTKVQMIEDLIQEMGEWDAPDIFVYATEMYRSKLRGMTEEMVREEYIGVYGDDE